MFVGVVALCYQHRVTTSTNIVQSPLTMFVGVVALCYQHRVTIPANSPESFDYVCGSCGILLSTLCHNSHKHGQSRLI